MSYPLAIRRTGRLRPCLHPAFKAVYHVSRRQLATRSQQLHQTLAPFSLPQHRPFSHSPTQQNNAPLNVLPPTGPQGQHSGRRGTWKQWVLFNLAGVTGIAIFAIALKNGPGGDNDGKNSVINTKSFSAFTITSKEQVSPTAFVLSIRPGSGSGSGSSAKLKEAWDHGLWSVEVKQPQLQIARHYTPLPPVSGLDSEPASDGGNDGGDGELRFLVRKVDGGEMSTYLSKLRVGENVYLRGPHLGLDIGRRLGNAENVVFLAGGTGIAPALQIARKVLEGSEATKSGRIEGGKPTVSILWANRLAADAIGRQQQQSGTKGSGWWPSTWWGETPSPSDTKAEHIQTQQAEESSLARQIRELQQKHPEHFRIRYFVDEEGSFIKEPDLRSALATPHTSSPSPSLSPSSSPTPQRRQPKPLFPVASTCPWHSPAALERLPDDDDVGRHDSTCTCTRDPQHTSSTGANLVCVSGPDGFVAAYAGPKRWFGGKERQGPVRGMLEQTMKGSEMEKENWLVLKL